MTKTNKTTQEQRLDRITARVTAYDTYSALLAACATGYAPSISSSSVDSRRERAAKRELVAALRTDGHRVFSAL